jgi:hypothetical protein
MFVAINGVILWIKMGGGGVKKRPRGTADVARRIPVHAETSLTLIQD